MCSCISRTMNPQSGFFRRHYPKDALPSDGKSSVCKENPAFMQELFAEQRLGRFFQGELVKRKRGAIRLL